MLRLASTVIFSLLFLAVFGASALRAQSFHGIGNLSGGAAGSYAYGVSADGRVVVGWAQREKGYESFRWTAEGGMTGLGSLKGASGNSMAKAASADGTVVVGQSDALSGITAYRWAGGEMEEIDFYADVAEAVSANGSVIAGTANYTNQVGAFRWTSGGGAVPLGYLSGGYRSSAYGVSADGSVVVGSSISPDRSEAFRWENGTMTGLGDLSGGKAASVAVAVSADGSVVAGFSSSADAPDRQAFRWTAEEGMVALDLLPGTFASQANAVSDDGSRIVGYAQGSNGLQLATIWVADGSVRLFQDVLQDQGLDLTSWSLSEATGISADGTVIVGRGINPQGRPEGWHATILPIEREDIVVTTTGDEENDPISQEGDLCDVDREAPDRQCTLRAAIELANERDGGTITFDIPASGVPSIMVENLTEVGSIHGLPTYESLPRLTSRITIDGTTQPGGWVEVVGPRRSGAPFDDLNGAEGAPGIWIAEDGAESTVRGLVINGFTNSGVFVQGHSSVIEQNRIGTDATGTKWRGNGRRLFTGGLRLKSSSNVVADNVIAGNAYSDGTRTFGHVELLIDIGSHRNTITGNRIGVGADGRVVAVPPYELSFDFYSIGIALAGNQNTIGGGDFPDGPPAICGPPCNVIAGHQIEVGCGSAWEYDCPKLIGRDNRVVGNVIGADLHRNPAPTLEGGGFTGAHPTVWGGPDYSIHGNYILVADHQNMVAVAANSTVTGNVIHGRHTGLDETKPHGLVYMTGEGSVLRGNEIRTSPNYGVYLANDGHTVADNRISDHDGGIVVASGAGHRIEANEIFDVRHAGVLLSEWGVDDPTAVISANRIYGAGVGIDLGGYRLLENPWAAVGDGVTLNDYGDHDDGPNNLLNYPVPLQVSRLGRVVQVEGELWGAYSGEYTVEVFGNSTCSEATRAGRFYGAGEHYMGSFTVTPAASDIGAPGFSFVEGGLENHLRFVSLTASRADLGITSEFSPCVLVANADDVAKADVEPGKVGKIIDAVSVIVSIASAANGKSPSSTALHDGGTIYVTRYVTAPDTSIFADTTATSPGGSSVRPEAVAARYWTLGDRGLTAPGGEDGSTVTFEICLDPTDVVAPSRLDEIVLVQRDEATEGLWQPRATYSNSQNGKTYLCAQNVTTLGAFGLGGAEAAFPVGIEEGEGILPRENAEGGMPGKTFALGAAYPNPFSQTTNLDVTIPEPGPVTVAVYDVLGRPVAVLIDDVRTAGVHRVEFDAVSLPSGVYLVRMVAGGISATQRVTVLR